jgi:small-conductance mechanosensitive channel
MIDEIKLSFIDEYLKTANGSLNFLGKIIYVIVIVLVAKILIQTASKLLSKSVTNKMLGDKRNYNRILTVTKLLDRVIKIIISFFAITIGLDIFGINTNSIIATIGIGSLALSFGAQNLVKDFINGIFLIVEDQYRVGDLIEVAGIEGYVELLGVRTTQIRDFAGNIHTVPNGQIDLITNKSRGNMRARIDIPLDITVDPQTFIDGLKEKLSYLKNDDRLTKEVDIWGVSKNRTNGYDVTVCAFTKPGNQFDIEYEIRQKVIELFNEKDLKTPKVRAEVKHADI